MQVATAIEQGFREIYPEAEYVKLPMADGGEGTVESMVEATEGHYLFQNVTGPLGTPVQARWGMLGDGKTAIVEMASASGLHHVPPECRNPMLTTSYGTGELILAALDHGVERIILGIGGSATLPEALQDAEYNLRVSARNIASVWKLSQQQMR